MKIKTKYLTVADNTTLYIYPTTDDIGMYTVIGTDALTTGNFVIDTDASETDVTEVYILWQARLTKNAYNPTILGRVLTDWECMNDNLFRFIYYNTGWQSFCLTSVTNTLELSDEIFGAAGGITGGDGNDIIIDISSTVDTNKSPTCYTDSNGLGIMIDDYHFRTDWNTLLSRGTNPKWIYFDTSSDFSTTPASTSTITMLTDLTSLITPGMAVRYKIGGAYYYGIITALSNVLMTIAGAPLGGTIQELYWSPDPETVQVNTYLIGENFNDANDTTLLENDNDWKGGDVWLKTTAKCVHFTVINKSNDSSANPLVNVSVGGNVICSSNTDKGLAVSTTIAKTVVDIKTANYEIGWGDAIEIAVDKNGGTGDADYLLVAIVFVYV